MNSLLLACLFTAVIALLIPGTGEPGQKAGPYAGDITCTSTLTPEDFAPDGDLSKKVWRNTKQVRFDREAFTGGTHPEAETSVASVWTEKYVYFAFRCRYSELNVYTGEPVEREKWGLWDRDVVEAFINPEPERFNHYFEFEVAPNNQWVDLEIDLDKKPFNSAAWDSRFVHATRVDEANRVWTCEMKIPIKALTDRTVSPGDKWRINFYRADGKGDDSKRRFLSWSRVPTGKRTFHQPASFGILRFTK